MSRTVVGGWGPFEPLALLYPHTVVVGIGCLSLTISGFVALMVIMLCSAYRVTDTLLSLLSFLSCGSQHVLLPPMEIRQLAWDLGSCKFPVSQSLALPAITPVNPFCFLRQLSYVAPLLSHSSVAGPEAVATALSC